jgi:hypothetical protein
MKPTMTLIVIACIAAVAVLMMTPRGETQEEPKRDPANIVGHKACAICHKSDESGNQIAKWQEGPHAKAFELLGTPKAKEVAAKLNIADPQKSGTCLQCHSTAHHWTEKVVTDKLKPEDSVSCESCHGPGKKYLPKTVHGESREKGIAAGLIYPAMQSCTKCHNDSSPTWNPERYTTKDGKKVGFDPEQAFEKIKHPNPRLKR